MNSKEAIVLAQNSNYSTFSTNKITIIVSPPPNCGGGEKIGETICPLSTFFCTNTLLWLMQTLAQFYIFPALCCVYFSEHNFWFAMSSSGCGPAPPCVHGRNVTFDPDSQASVCVWGALRKTCTHSIPTPGCESLSLCFF